MTLEYFKPAFTALMVIDTQKDFCYPKGFFDRNGKNILYMQTMLPKLQEVVDKVREMGIRIIFIKSHFDEKSLSPSMRVRKKNLGRTEDVCPEGSWGSELIITPKPEDIIIIKHSYSAFIGTSLEQILRKEGIESLVISGMLTNVCCESTLRDGFMLGFKTILLRDCCASDNLEAHNETIYNVSNYFGWVYSSDILLNFWKSNQWG
jgi:ureidoacrylate peracid hydrolase